MFGGVIERFDSAIKTQQLKNAKISDELIQQVQEGMTTALTMVHDESLLKKWEMILIDKRIFKFNIYALIVIILLWTKSSLYRELLKFEQIWMRK